MSFAEPEKEELNRILQNEKIIGHIVEIYDCDPETAKTIWSELFAGTVKKLQTVVAIYKEDRDA